MSVSTIQGYKEEFNTIAGIFQTGWVDDDTAELITPILWPGINSTVPTDSSGKPANHVMFFITNGGSRQISTGADTNIFRHVGLVSCKIFCVTGRGEVEAKEYADKFCNIFRGYSASGLRFQAPYSVVIGDDGNGFYQINAFAPFERDSYL